MKNKPKFCVVLRIFRNYILWSRHFDPAAKSKKYFLWSYSSENMMKNGSQIIFLSKIIQKVFLPWRKVPLMISWRWLRPFSPLILCFLGAEHLLNIFLKKFRKNFVRSFDPPPRSRLIFYVWVNSPEKMMKNGGRIIFIS